MSTYKLEDVIKTLDMTHKKHSSGNRASLSEYYLTDWILNWSAASAQALTYSDGTFGISDAGGVISYPINQLTGVTKITFKARRTGNTMYFDGCVLKIINSEAVVFGGYSATLGTSWTEFEVDIDNGTVDYFEAYAGGGYGAYVEIKDVVFTVSSNGGGAGSGYIGNPLVSNKKMVGYNVPTSSAESTKTESVSQASATPVSGKPKIGNGFARIKFLHDYTPTFPITSYDKAILFPSDDMPVKLYQREDATVADVYSTFDQRSDTCFLIWDTNTSTYLIYRFRAAEQGGRPFRVVSYQYMEQEGTANEIWGMNAETHELYPTDGYGRNLGRIWLPSIVKDGGRYDGAGAYGGASSEHPTIYCSKLSADVYIDDVLVGHYNHD